MKYLVIYSETVVAKFSLESDRNEYIKLMKEKYPKNNYDGVYSYE